MSYKARIRKQRMDQKDLLLMQMIQDGNPSIQEMCTAIRVRSTNSVANRLKWLEENGYVIQPKVRQPRSRTLTPTGLDALVQAGLRSGVNYGISNRDRNPTK